MAILSFLAGINEASGIGDRKDKDYGSVDLPLHYRTVELILMQRKKKLKPN